MNEMLLQIDVQNAKVVAGAIGMTLGLIVFAIRCVANCEYVTETLTVDRVEYGERTEVIVDCMMGMPYWYNERKSLVRVKEVPDVAFVLNRDAELAEGCTVTVEYDKQSVIDGEVRARLVNN